MAAFVVLRRCGAIRAHMFVAARYSSSADSKSVLPTPTNGSMSVEEAKPTDLVNTMGLLYFMVESRAEELATVIGLWWHSVVLISPPDPCWLPEWNP